MEERAAKELAQADLGDARPNKRLIHYCGRLCVHRSPVGQRFGEGFFKSLELTLI